MYFEPPLISVFTNDPQVIGNEAVCFAFSRAYIVMPVIQSTKRRPARRGTFQGPHVLYAGQLRGSETDLPACGSAHDSQFDGGHGGMAHYLGHLRGRYVPVLCQSGLAA